MELLKYIIENIKNKKILWFILVIISLIWLKNNMPNYYNELIDVLELTINRIYVDIFSCLVMTILFYSFYLLIKYSDKKYEEDYKEKEEICKRYVSNTKYPLQVKVVENYKYMLLGKKPYRKITLINNSGETLKFAEGYIDFYSSKERFSSIPFKIKNLEDGYGHIILKQELDTFEGLWDEFNFFIVKARCGQVDFNNIRFDGEATLTILPVIRKYYKLEKLIPYDLTWLKDQISFYVIPRIKWHFRIQTVYEKQLTSKTTKNRRNNLLRIIFTIPIIVCLIIFLIIMFGKVFILFADIFILWGKSFYMLLVK